jgi:RNA polymerase sigma-70 factor, ECF subfamily
VTSVALAGADAVAAERRFEQIYVELWPRIAGYCYRHLGDQQLAADVAQEAFMRLFARITSIDEPSAWLFRVATNLCHDAHRRAQRQDRLHRQVGELTDQHVTNPDPSVRDVVDRLPARLRDVVVLHYWADLPVEEVARVLRRPTGTVKRRLLEARALLAEPLRSTP